MMDSVGELLRRERLRQGLELAQVAERTRINPAYLEAIEAGDTASLPGAFFHRAFVRQYARALGIEERQLEPTLSELREQAEAAQPVPTFEHISPQIEVPPIPTPGSQRRFSGPKPSSIVLLIAVIVACSGIYALWQRTRILEPVATPPPQPVRVEARSTAPQPQPAAETSPAGTPAPVPATQPPAATAAAQPPETASPNAPPASGPPPAEGKLNVEVTATEAVWLSVTTDGKKTTMVLTEGQTRRFSGNERSILFIGNAGGLEVRVNGKPIGTLGPRGHLRTVVITPEGVSITNPREKKAEPPPP